MAKAAVRKAAVRVVITNQYEEVLLQKRDANAKPYPGRWCTFGAEVQDTHDVRFEALHILRGELDWTPSSGGADLRHLNPALGGWDYQDEAG
ncbi:MAG: hypothetical protein Q8R28_03580, partial [Dehalococcoidia bacterium]|nr:hypothetical protein [Dehalococcoidia bacterium]